MEVRKNVSSLPTDDNLKKNAIKSKAFFEKNLISENLSLTIINIFSKTDAAKYEAIPIKIEGNILSVVAAANSPIFQMQVQIESYNVNVLLTDNENIKTALWHYYQVKRKQRKENSEIENSPLRAKILEIISDAVMKKASDIHFLPIENEKLQVELRINGHLINYTNKYDIESTFASNVSVIIKDMDTSKQAKLEDSLNINQGSFETECHNQKVNIRISTIPCVFGEKIVLRLLPKNNKRKRLSELGYTDDDLRVIKKALIMHSTGLYIMSGPTGSGKTTSIYGEIDEELDYTKVNRNVVTIEDPVEIYEPHFCQTQINHADLLKRSAEDIFNGIMRQDPDLILYNEIRNSTDAKVAVRLAMSGHQTFTTVHAKNVVTTLLRLMDLGVDRATLLEQLNLIVSQRLVSILCPKCSEDHSLTKEEEEYLNKSDVEVLIKGSGLKKRGSLEKITKCECKSGYIKRIAIAEYVHFDNDLRDIFLNEKLSFKNVYEILKKKGYKSMWEKGLELVANGQSDLEEVISAIGK